MGLPGRRQDNLPQCWAPCIAGMGDAFFPIWSPSGEEDSFIKRMADPLSGGSAVYSCCCEDSDSKSQAESLWLPFQQDQLVTPVSLEACKILIGLNWGEGPCTGIVGGKTSLERFPV